MRNYIFEIKESLMISLQAILANKVRSILTTLGVLIGIAAVIIMATLLNGMDNAFQNGISILGSDNLYISKWAWFDDSIPWWELRNRKNLTYEQFQQYEKKARLPLAVAPMLYTSQNLKHEDNTLEYNTIVGTTNNYLQTSNLEFKEGRFFTQVESNSARNVIVIGSTVEDNLFPEGGALNQYIKVKGRKFKVIGVLSKQGSFMMGDMNPDILAYVPIGTVFKFMQRSSRSGITFNVKARNSSMVEKTKDEAITLMRQIRGLSYADADDFSVNQQEGLQKNIQQTTSVIKIAGFFITGLALFVGAIGIMNIMFVSVKERTREIGIRKAIGARSRTVLGQFLFESSILCLLGGVFGLIFAKILTMIINQFLPATIQIDAVILAFIISLLTGIFSGLAPAYKAAKMDPVDALRYE